MTNSKTEGYIGHVTPAGGNVFLDLGFPPDEAAALKAEVNELVAKKRQAKREERARQKSAQEALRTKTQK